MTRGRLRRVGEHVVDPLQGVANLFDVGVVFALGFLLALMSTTGVARALMEKHARGDQADTRLEQMPKAGSPLGRYRVTERHLGGQGVRLGTAWRLNSGEVVYIPEK